MPKACKAGIIQETSGSLRCPSLLISVLPITVRRLACMPVYTLVFMVKFYTNSLPTLCPPSNQLVGIYMVRLVTLRVDLEKKLNRP